MSKKINYAKLFTRRKDGIYQKYVNGKYLYSKDPEELYRKWQAYLEGPKEKTFREVASEWEGIHREEISARTWANYRPHYDALVSEFGSVLITELTAQDVNNWLLKMKSRGYSATIVKTVRTILMQIMDYAVTHDFCKYNPVSSIRLPKNLPHSERSAPTEAEMETVIRSVELPFGFFAFLLLCTGLRKGEALALTRSDVDLENRLIRVTKALEYKDGSTPYVKSPKTESGVRDIPIVDLLYAPLLTYLSGLPGDILFPAAKSNRNPGGGYMTTRGYDIAWANYQKATGLSITAHQLRHGTATLLYEAGVDLYTSKAILGHADVKTTLEIYTELRQKQQAKSTEAFNQELRKYLKKI